jgi:hypothetical protein
VPPLALCSGLLDGVRGQAITVDRGETLRSYSRLSKNRPRACGSSSPACIRKINCGGPWTY